jgi:ParB/RepB/Spo0J family partition protein
VSEPRRINPFKCRMWSMHDRLGEDSRSSSAAYRALVASIRAQGQKQPALGRYTRGPDEHEVELIYGARRLAAAKELGIDLLVVVRDIDDRDAIIEMDIENRVREDISPYDRGMSYRRWLRSGYFATQTEIAKALGVSEAQICRLLKYADLPAVVVGAFRSPQEIREEWAGNLSNLCKHVSLRGGILRRARHLSTSPAKLRAQETYDALVADGRNAIVRSRATDEVVKGRRGQPLFRIGFRAKTVHWIVPRYGLSADALAQITDQLKTSLDTNSLQSAQPDSAQGKDSASRSAQDSTQLEQCAPNYS